MEVRNVSKKEMLELLVDMKNKLEEIGDWGNISEFIFEQLFNFIQENRGKGDYTSPDVKARQRK